VDDAAAYRYRDPNKRAEEIAPGQQPSAALSNRPHGKLIDAAARDAALDPALVHAVIYVESRYDQRARSKKGALGLMQVLPETAARYGIANSGQSTEANLQAGTRYLSDLMRLFDCRVDLALAAYNAGEGAVLRYGSRIPPYSETKAYVPAVLAKFEEWREHTQPAPALRQRPIEYMPGLRLELEYSGALSDPSREQRELGCPEIAVSGKR
jgi:soluble lytic murein transglycosylase-like protein